MILYELLHIVPSFVRPDIYVVKNDDFLGDTVLKLDFSALCELYPVKDYFVEYCYPSSVNHHLIIQIRKEKKRNV